LRATFGLAATTALTLSGTTAVFAAGRAESQSQASPRSQSTSPTGARLLPGDTAAQNTFGVSVAISGDTALVGATTAKGGPGHGTGAVYVFVKGPRGWYQQARLTASDGAARDNFGFSVALDGDTAVVGAPNRGQFVGDTLGEVGAAYVYKRSGTTWSQQAILTQTAFAPGAQTGDFFGFSVAVSGSTLLVGAAGVNANTGAVFEYVRSKTAWSETAKLVGSDSQPGDGFGWDVALSGRTALIGAPRNSPAFRGAAYIFASVGRHGFAQQARLAPPDSQNGDLFGRSVALSGQTALVGAPGCCAFDPKEGAFRGAAYTFVRDGHQWINRAKLTAGDGKPFLLDTNQEGDTFGESVALSGDTAVIGAPTKAKHPATVGAPIDVTGAAYEFRRDGGVSSGRWSQRQKLTAKDGGRLDMLGFAVGIAGGAGLVGAPFHHTDRGIVYLFGL
jgi:hypothetical protein